MWPVAGAGPIFPSSRPRPQAARPRSQLPPDRTPTMLSPKTVSISSSGAPKSSTKGRAICTKPDSARAPNNPPTSEAENAAAKACRALPALASGKPSITVACDPADPGMPIRTEVNVSAVASTASRPIIVASAEA